MRKKSIVFNADIYDWDELKKADQELLTAAKNAINGSYAPYSKFKVGAAVRLTDGTIVCGANQENAAYPSGLCAERTAILVEIGTHIGNSTLVVVGGRLNQQRDTVRRISLIHYLLIV